MKAVQSLRNYAVITGGYWAFTLTDGAIRMLVVLYFHQLGYTPLAIASLFLFYEFFGIITNLVGGWLGARFGLNKIMHIGMLLQVFALLMLTVPNEYLTIIYVMAAQAVSGIAKDLNKMSAKASVKLFIPSDTANASSNKLFKWIAILTGSKNTLKGVGFFLGGLLLTVYDFQTALLILAGGLFIVFVITLFLLPRDLGKTKEKAKFSHVFANDPAINWLSAARFFLFGSRDVWFVIALPVYLSSTLGWGYEQTGGFLALWIIGYGIIQALTPKLLKHHSPNGKTAQHLAFALIFIPAGIALALTQNISPNWVIITGLSLFAIVFAINSAVHSYLIVAWSDHDKVAMNVGFYYMANAGGRLTGTLLSGLLFQHYGLSGCLIASSLFLTAATLLSRQLTPT
ncbi:MAG: organoarsenical effux MFS transporter ArsJ [Piscirickettsiaceae bacterium]|nr:organoarsenical effux MFS transporter ArsJ [Piscirickettsiaceae bacterium]